MIAAAKKPILIQLHKLRRQHQTKKSSQPSIRFIESTAFQLSLVCSHIKINLFFMINSISSHIVIQNVMLFLQFHQLHYREHGVSLFEYKQKIDIPMKLFLRQRDIGFYLMANRTDELIDLVSDFVVLLRCQFLSVFKSVSSHSKIKIISFFYIHIPI